MSDPAQRTVAVQVSRWDAIVAETVAGAARRSPGFRRRLAAADLEPDELSDVASLDRLPVLTKDELLAEQRADPPFGGYLATDARPSRIFQSPGPLYEPERPGTDPWRWASALELAGFGPGDVVLNAFGYHLSPAGAMFDAACQAVGATVVPGGVGNRDLQVQACADLPVTAYIGPPSYLKALLETAEEAGRELAIARAFVTAEPLPPSLRAWLSERVGVVRQGYGTAETGLLGAECEVADGMHVPDDALVQVCDLTDGHARVDDGEGQVVVTLDDTDYPVIRFGTGDLSAWHSEPCPCGRPTPRLRGWLGRVGDAVKVKGMFLHPRQVAAVLAGFPEVRAYHLAIDRAEHRDQLTCEIVTDGDRTSIAQAVADAMREGLRFRVEVVAVDQIDDDAPAFDDRRRWD